MSDDKPTTGAAAQDAPNNTTDATKDGDTGKTFTQEQVNDLLARQKGDVQRKFTDYDDLKAKASQYDELVQKDQSDMDKLTGKLTKAEQAKADAEARLLRYEVAAEKDVPSKLVALLTASSKEELEAQADLILENAKPATPDFDGGVKDPAPDPKTPEQAHNEFVLGLLGRTPS